MEFLSRFKCKECKWKRDGSTTNLENKSCLGNAPLISTTPRVITVASGKMTPTKFNIASLSVWVAVILSRSVNQCEFLKSLTHANIRVNLVLMDRVCKLTPIAFLLWTVRQTNVMQTFSMPSSLKELTMASIYLLDLIHCMTRILNIFKILVLTAFLTSRHLRSRFLEESTRVNWSSSIATTVLIKSYTRQSAIGMTRFSNKCSRPLLNSMKWFKMIGRKSLFIAQVELSDHQPSFSFISAYSWSTKIGRIHSR